MSCCNWRIRGSIGENHCCHANLSRRDFLMSASAATLASAATKGFAASRTPTRLRCLRDDRRHPLLRLESRDRRTHLRRRSRQYLHRRLDLLLARSQISSSPHARSTASTANRPAKWPASAWSTASSSRSPRRTPPARAPATAPSITPVVSCSAADYGGGSAASFKVTDGKLSPLVWSEHYTVHGPNPDRQEAAHAHFASFSPDNRFAYINDLGGD